MSTSPECSKRLPELAAFTLVLLLGACDRSPTETADPIGPGGTAGAGVKANGYSFQPFDVAAERGSGTSVFGVNNRGTLVGNYLTTGFSIIGFVSDGVRFTDVVLPGSDPFNRGALNAVNDQGTATGSFIDAATGVMHGFTRSKSGGTTVIPDPLPGATFMDALGINNRSVIVGVFADDQDIQHGFFSRSDATISVFDYPGSTGTTLEGINDAGSAVGYWNDPGFGLHGFLLRNGRATSIAPPGAILTLPRAINNRGVIAGTWWDDTFTLHGFLLDHGTYTTVDYPGATDTELLGINDEGVLVGSYDGFSRGFIAVPAP